MKENKVIQPRMTNPFNNDTDFSPRNPAYKPPHSGGLRYPGGPTNANIDVKLKLFKAELLKELSLALVVDGGDLDA